MPLLNHACRATDLAFKSFKVACDEPRPEFFVRLYLGGVDIGQVDDGYSGLMIHMEGSDVIHVFSFDQIQEFYNRRKELKKYPRCVIEEMDAYIKRTFANEHEMTER